LPESSILPSTFELKVSRRQEIEFCQTEVEHLYGVVVSNLYIGRFQVAVDDPALMGVFEGIRN
jgi:hypothetical protein